MSEAEPIPPTSSVTALRIPMIKKGEYDLWSMKMRQYIAITDHILCDIITNGDQATTDPASSSGPVSAPKTSLAANARRNNEKALNILLSAIYLNILEDIKHDPYSKKSPIRHIQYLLQVKQKDDGIFISQDKYVADILKKFDFATVKTASTLIETNKALLKDEEAEDVDVHIYRSMIRSLMYLTASRPDIIFVVCACARFQVTPKVSHLHAVKRIFRYLKGNLQQEVLNVKKQTIVANLTTKAEYVVAANCYGHVLWVQNKMLDYGFNFINTKIYINNESTICIVKNLVFHSKTKYTEIRHHFIRDTYEKKLIQVIKIHTDHNVADLLTKAFDVSRKAKRTTEISQSSRPILLISYETVIKEREDRMERAATTASSLVAKQDNGNINRTQSMATLNESFPHGTDSGSGPRLNLLLPVFVYAARHTLTVVRHKLMLPGITYYCWFWASAKAKIVNGERQIQALVDKNKVIITETSIRSDLKLDDAEGIYCLPTATIFAELERMSAKTTVWNEFSRTMASAIIFFLDKQVEGMTRHKDVYVTPSHTKKVFVNMKRPGKGFSGRVTPLFPTMMIQASEDLGEDSVAPSDSHSTPINSQLSSFNLKRRSQGGNREKTLVLQSLSLMRLMYLPLSMIHLKVTAQAKEITSLKKRVKQLEKRKKLRTQGLKRLRKVGSTSRVESSNDVNLGAQEDASKQWRKITDLDADAKEKGVAEKEVKQEKEVAEKEVTTANAHAPTTTINELTLAKDKGKEIMVEPERPLKKKDQVALDEEMARNLEAQMQAKLIEEERIARKKEEEANIASIK
ncbi:hypothetical protein Tco_0523188 [Tanacetum coccineum]